MKERYQNPTVDEEIRLRLFSYNSNNRANFSSIEKVEIYYLDETNKSSENPDGRTLIQTIDSTDVTQEDIGLYSIVFMTESPNYVIGNYLDIWYVTINNDSTSIENKFSIYPSLWFTDTTPIVYDFNFSFKPNKLKKNSKRWLIIEITPNIPNESDLASYYMNLATISPFKIFISQKCAPCMPEEADLRLKVDGENVELRERCTGYYLLDTKDLDCGLYDVWFELEIGDSIYISDHQTLQIY